MISVHEGITHERAEEPSRAAGPDRDAQGLWMTTDTIVTALTPPPVVQFRSVQAAAGLCVGAETQAAINDRAFQSFLTTSETMSRQLHIVEAALTSAQRPLGRPVQKAWITYSTANCQFESSAIRAGSASQMVQWQCSDRLTRQRITKLLHLDQGRDGDISCPLARRATAP